MLTFASLVATIALSSYLPQVAADTRALAVLAGNTVDVSAGSNSWNFVVSNDASIYSGVTLGSVAGDPSVEITGDGVLKLWFPQGIASTTDFTLSSEVDLVLDAGGNSNPPYFAEDPDPTGSILVSEFPIPENGSPNVQATVHADVNYPACWTAAHANIPVVNLVNSRIEVIISSAASAPEYCSISYTWPITAAQNNDCLPGQNGCAHGDPQFSGFLGQSYQVHGVSGQVYNILSTPHFQYNALFTFLEQGQCRKGTQCFSHPGNYFGQVGLLFRSPEGAVSVVRVVAGPVDAGLKVFLNDAAVNVSSAVVPVGEASITFANPFDLVVEAPEFSMKLSNSDMFINQDVSINSSLMKDIQEFKHTSKSQHGGLDELKSKLPHGLLGQTWQSKTYANRWKYIEGTLFEYSVSDGLTGTQFKYNRF